MSPPKHRLAILVLPFVMAVPALGQVAADIGTELQQMRETDQRGRLLIQEIEAEHGYDSAAWRAAWDEQAAIDAANMQRLAAIVAEHGWPKMSEVGELAAEAAFLVLQHADGETQKQYVEVLRAAVAAGEAEGSSYAMLQDRVLMRENRKQRYGTQFYRNDSSAGWYLWPIEDEATVDARRAELGMGTVQSYLDRLPFELEAVPPEVGAALRD